MPYYTPKLLAFRCIQLTAREDLARAIMNSENPEEYIRIHGIYPKVSVALLKGYPTYKIISREVDFSPGEAFEADPASSLIKIKP